MTKKKVYWLSDKELQLLAENAVEAGISIEDAKKQFAKDDFMIDGKAIYFKKFVSYYYNAKRDTDVSNYFSGV